MHIVNLIRKAEVRLLEPSLVFHSKVHMVVAILRAKGVLSISRCSLNAGVHNLFAAMLITAHYEDTSMDVTSRRQGDLHDQGITTRAYEWLDELVRLELIIPVKPSLNAHGKLILGNLLRAYLEEEVVTDAPEVLERWNADALTPSEA